MSGIAVSVQAEPTDLRSWLALARRLESAGFPGLPVRSLRTPINSSAVTYNRTAPGARGLGAAGPPWRPCAWSRPRGRPADDNMPRRARGQKPRSVRDKGFLFSERNRGFTASGRTSRGCRGPTRDSPQYAPELAPGCGEVEQVTEEHEDTVRICTAGVGEMTGRGRLQPFRTCHGGNRHVPPRSRQKRRIAQRRDVNSLPLSPQSHAPEQLANDPAFMADPHSSYARWRHAGPVHRAGVAP